MSVLISHQCLDAGVGWPYTYITVTTVDISCLNYLSLCLKLLSTAPLSDIMSFFYLNIAASKSC